ncbi:uncharacterized protein LAESUDRAFT_720978 [Laetiporus sulphureus 93-53]|uniref:SEC7 domain-containing protein n=1 Tax=Laetiporus sulphureus 93-53 TaxID=1314785 RepID=A0A165GPE2_9APHY|nr:uncharacterized protein LAESUDRAFT_720978 [Laetiporus sulphureus 93-53]KZT10625.1 hypothetical protein LAESUDRAFT_720978 [Laetiporus sulphureus 93-53]
MLLLERPEDARHRPDVRSVRQWMVGQAKKNASRVGINLKQDRAGRLRECACSTTTTTTTTPTLASLFKQPSPRSPAPPPSSFPSAFQPVASHDPHVPSRRTSRTDLDFEHALRTGGTVLLRESFDLDNLGADSSSTSSFLPPSSPSPRKSFTGLLPATPTVIPPTPIPRAGPSTSSSAQSPASILPLFSSGEMLSDSPGSDYETRRRSLYRSPGTASSPDLATLLRKAKERNAAANKDASKAHESSSPQHRAFSRQRSTISTTPSLSSSPEITPATRNRSLKPSQVLGVNVDQVSSPDWAWTSPRSAVPPKSGKSSVRQKTSAFLGRMLGSPNTRERSRTINSSPSTTSVASYPSTPLMDAFTPPVPPIPPKYVSPRPDPVDLFSDTSSGDVHKVLATAPSSSNSRSSDLSDQSLVLVEVGVLQNRSRSPSPTTTLRQRPSDAGASARHIRAASRSKRRSMSVSDADLKKLMGMGAPMGHLSGEGHRTDALGLGLDTALNGIMTDFRGELSQLDPISAAPLDLQYLSTSARRPQLATLRARSDGVAARSQPVDNSRPLSKHASSSPADIPAPTPTVTLQPAESSVCSSSALSSPDTPSPIDSFPPRSSSSQGYSQMTLRSRSGSSSMVPPRTASLKYAPRSPSVRKGSSHSHTHSRSRDADRLRVHHRSTASTSEPSLVPESYRDELGRVRSAPRIAASSQQDLTTSDLLAVRYNLTPRERQSPMRGEETAELDSRGKELAARCWAEDEEFLAKDKIAEWLGGQSLINKTALRHYMDNFDFSDMRLDHAFRRLCGKLYLKAETQQVDRILEEFARRYFQCNPTSILGSAGVVHAVTYSLLLLNTDLHVADLAQRMSRGQFVRNTLATIMQPDNSNSDLSYDDWTSFRAGSESDIGGATVRGRAKRSDSIISWNSVTTRDGGVVASPTADHPPRRPSSVSDGVTQHHGNGSAVSVAFSARQESKAPERDAPPSAVVHGRNWENEIESLLKDMYNAVKSQQILQPINSTFMARSSTSSLTPHGPLLRQRSLRGPPDRLANLKRGSIRGLQSILHTQSGVSPYSSNSSIDGRASPAPSFANSVDNVHASSTTLITPAIGFASNLSHTIIREAQEDDHSFKSNGSSTDISITDEELALLGAPWAKEGMLCRKQYWESTGKRAKSKAWMDVFVVIQKGELSMFVFGEHAHGQSTVVGGGNWHENAQSVGKIILAHSLAHGLPPPGYNRQRPHCMVLTLSNGAVYFFQAGTEELVNEWVATCNYWAARQSKEPLAGGVSNMEYGWNRVLDPITRVRSISEDNYSTHEAETEDGVSIRSGRSRLREFAATVRAEKSPWVDRTFINDWKPPMPPTVPSTHDEETQMEALQKHVGSLKAELKQHNELREPMNNLYQPRSSNAAKAMSNWEKKSQYLLAEIIKYDSYIESLQAAMSLRLKRRGEKALERALVVSSPTEEEFSDTAIKSKWRGQPDQDTIEEGEEPPASAGVLSMPTHRREMAQIGDDDDT